MVILEVFSKNLSITYKTTLISKAALVAFIFGVISIVLPFIFAYKSKGFWIKRDVLYEQPDIKFTGEYIFIAMTNNLKTPVITCSTVEYFQKNNLDRCSMAKVKESDKNFDKKVEEFDFSLEVDLPAGTSLTHFQIIIFLNYKLHVCPLQMHSAVIYQTFLSFPIMKYVLRSTLGISQKNPLKCHKCVNNFYNQRLFDIDLKEQDIVDFIITEYSQRNVSTVLENIYTNFIPGNHSNFILDIHIQYPEDKIYYNPGFWQIMKWALIQYLAIYLIVSFLVSKIKNYIFVKRLVLFYEDNPLKKNH